MAGLAPAAEALISDVIRTPRGRGKPGRCTRAGEGLTVQPADTKQGIEALRSRMVNGRVVLDFSQGVPP